MSRPITCKPFNRYRAPDNFEQFIRELQELTGDQNGAKYTIDPRKYAAALGMEIQALASRAGVHRSTLTRNPCSPAVQAYLNQALRVISAAAALNGHLFDTLFWFRNEPIRAFDYETAERLVGEGRTDNVLSYLHSLPSTGKTSAP